MAADTRPYKSKEQDGQGNEIILRDQQLVEQASQTTMASDEYFEIVDVDGRMAKIPKANMVDIVREALGSLLNGLTDQTTVTKVPSLNGNTLGASTVATLASVLGVPLYAIGSLSDTTIQAIQSAYQSATQYTKFEGTVANVGYYIGMKAGNDGKAGVLLLCPDATYILHRNFGSVTSGKWKVFKVVA